MTTRDEVLRFLIQVQGSGELDALVAELKQLTEEHPKCGVSLDALPAVSRSALMFRGGATSRYRQSEQMRMRRHMVCHFIAPSPVLSPENWAALLAERERVGRALCDSEARRVLAAEGGDDVDH